MSSENAKPDRSPWERFAAGQNDLTPPALDTIAKPLASYLAHFGDSPDAKAWGRSRLRIPWYRRLDLERCPECGILLPLGLRKLPDGKAFCPGCGVVFEDAEHLRRAMESAKRAQADSSNVQLTNRKPVSRMVL